MKLCFTIIVFLIWFKAISQKPKNDSISWEHHLFISTNLSLSQMNHKDDVFRDKDKFKFTGAEFNINYGYNIANIVGLYTGIDIINYSGTFNKNLDSNRYKLEETFLRIPLIISYTIPLRCLKGNCNRKWFFQLKTGWYASFSMKQNIGIKDFYSSTEKKIEWGYRKIGTINEISFISSNVDNENQGYGATHVFGIRLLIDNFNSVVIRKEDFNRNGFVTPYYNTISVYYNIINAFHWINYKKGRNEKITSD